MKTSLPASLALAALLPFVMATKCVDYDPGPGSAMNGSADGGAAAATGKACDQPGQARLKAENFAFQIQCGCAESAGKRCTVPLGTTIHWQFSDSTNHNITSIANSFGMSADTLSGKFTYTFTSPGTFNYGCSIHSLDMSGYQIVVGEGSR
jgi:plastocyanin